MSAINPDPFANLPDAVRSRMYECLNSGELSSLRCVNKDHKKHVVKKLLAESRAIRDSQKYDGLKKIITYELTPLQKLEREFIFFKDRPLWQRIVIVVAMIPLSPFIVAYHSPKILNAIVIHVVTPMINRIMQAAELVFDWTVKPVARFTYKYILTPLGRGTIKTAHFIYDWVLTPLGRTAVKTGNLFYDWILTPIGHGINKTYQFTYKHVLAPLGRLTAEIAFGILLGIAWAYDNFGGTLSKIAKFISDWVIEPVGTFIGNWVFVPIYNYILVPAFKVIRFIFNKVVIPLVNVLKVILKGVLVTLPTKVFVNVVKPAAELAGKYILSPLLSLIQKVGEILFYVVVVPAAQALSLGAGIVWNAVLLPAGTLIIAIPDIASRILFGK